MLQTLLRRIYKIIQSLLGVIGIYFVATRVSTRNRPELVNRAVWRPFVFEDYWRSLYLSTQALTGGVATDNIYRQCRFYSTFQMARYAASLHSGDVIECGCWHGHSTVAIATILAKEGFTGRFHVFDSFEGGLSSFGAKDQSFFRLSEQEQRVQIKQFESDFALVSAVTEGFGFVELHRGWIPQSFADFEKRPIKFLHVDVDMYEPTKATLDFFWESLVPGGCIVVDDYNHAIFEGATRAVDEFLEGKDPKLVYKVPMGSCYIIK
jgi:O-methyltransferase